ncbi:orotate phosphoribosyltransferase [Halofilum ochraceum]|uniref:orotate phosphoribosyltransferase n=1 Tax=Halofilum ochraceum TaxID=1611323 RepID=UPI0008DA0233|nr:orotate phosphoribosyltransferase [Halofilum ochraceum]
MRDYQRQFLELAVERGALRFGRFELKSGRVSPYFFNIGALDSGAALAGLGRAYANAIVDAAIDFDMLFGPAYKGIPLVSATAIALADGHDLDRPWCFDRKEAKDHGEGGNVVGAPLAGRVVIVDDVLTAGTAVRQAADLIRTAGAEVAAVVTALDRQERGLGERSAASEAAAALEAPVVSIVTLGDVLDYLDECGDRPGDRAQVAAYREQYRGLY